MNGKCEREADLIKMQDDIKEIKKDVKDLLKFKWQIIGGFALTLFAVTTTIQLIGVIK